MKKVYKWYLLNMAPCPESLQEIIHHLNTVHAPLDLQFHFWTFWHTLKEPHSALDFSPNQLTDMCIWTMHPNLWHSSHQVNNGHKIHLGKQNTTSRLCNFVHTPLAWWHHKWHHINKKYLYKQGTNGVTVTLISYTCRTVVDNAMFFLYINHNHTFITRKCYL